VKNIFIILLMPIFAFSFDLAIDVGHTPKFFGTTSSTCQQEYNYNLALSKHVYSYAKTKMKKTNINISIQEGETTFEDRYKSSINKDLFLSIHHDAMQEQFIKKDVNGCPNSNYASGFSLFISGKNLYYEKSLHYAKKIAKSLLLQGLKPTLHHAEPIQGENRQLIDKKLGIYVFDDLKVLKNAKSPAVLFEAGVIVNPIDEAKAKDKIQMDKIANAILSISK